MARGSREFPVVFANQTVIVVISKDKAKLYKNINSGGKHISFNKVGTSCETVRQVSEAKIRFKMASRDLEKEFDPTQWSNQNVEPKELLANHVEFGNRGV